MLSMRVTLMTCGPVFRSWRVPSFQEWDDRSMKGRSSWEGLKSEPQGLKAAENLYLRISTGGTGTEAG